MYRLPHPLVGTAKNACEVNNINYRNSEARAGFTIFGFIFIVPEMSHAPRMEELPAKRMLTFLCSIKMIQRYTEQIFRRKRQEVKSVKVELSLTCHEAI